MPRKNQTNSTQSQRKRYHLDQNGESTQRRSGFICGSGGILEKMRISTILTEHSHTHLFLIISILLPLALLVISAVVLVQCADSETPPPGKEVNNFRSMPAANPEMTFQIVPNASFVTLGVPFTTNEYGFRDQPTIQKTPGMFRVLCIGDSVTYGTGVTNQETFPNVLEALLQKQAGSSLKVDVINAGVSAYNIRNIRAQLETTIDAFQPEVVIYTFVENDLDDSLSAVPSGDLILYDPAKSLDSAFIYGSFAPHWMQQKKRFDETAGGFMIARKLSQWWNEIPDIAPPLGMGTYTEALARWRWVASEIQTMRDLCAKRGAKFSVLTFGTRNHSEPIQRKAQQICQQLGIPECSTLPLFDHRDYMTKHSLVYDSHCNPTALRMMADRIYSFLEDQQALPPACLRHPSDRQTYDETLDNAYTDQLEQTCSQAPESISLANGAGILGVLGGIDPQGRMARSCLFRLGGTGEVMEVDTHSLLEGDPQTLSARIEGGTPTTPILVPAQTTRFSFSLPQAYWNRPVEIELIAGGPSYVPLPEQRVMGAMPYTIALRWLARGRGQ